LPAGSKKGLGRALLNQLLEEAHQVGYEQIRLDSVRFMTEAHQLYRTNGFREIEAYEGSDNHCADEGQGAALAAA
jgi:GNAT superfamily N-acetyltransferase